ncbi:MAG: helix-turn-helix domain-containing protein [Oscillospiraceae bacterium]|nr:helix-turn-helix domain-containing protein [Oscillospiraceae bacterium]
MNNFGEHLKSIRKAKKVTQKQAAKAINVSERSYQSYEINESKPSFDSIIALADFFNISADYLLGRKEE